MAVTTIDWIDLEQSQGNITEVSVVAFHHRAIVASILIALTPFGLFGNALVIVAVVVAKKLRTITNILVINLTVIDLVTCLFFPFISAGLLSKREAILSMI